MSIAPNTTARFDGDYKRLRQVLFNLIGNAVKFTEKGTVELLVSQASPDTLQFSVTDSGIGIPQDKQQLIFDSFSQADSSNTRQHGGVGLGLAICQRLIDAMDGKIWVESKSGAGSSFNFHIPINSDAPTIDDTAASSGSTAQPQLQSERPVSILLAEDLADNAMVVAAFLKDTPYRLTTVNDGGKAVEEVLSGNGHDLILMDIQMPGMDGLEATRRIREFEERKQTKRVPILALTSHAMTGDDEKSVAAGCDGHITKPIAKKTLLETIASYLGS